MNSFEIDSMNTDKVKAMLKFNMLRLIWNIFRLIELALAIILLYWASARLPFAIRMSGDYFRRLISLVLSPIFVFLITNVIVFALVSKTGHNSAVNNAETEEYLCGDIIAVNGDNGFNDELRRELDEEIVYEDKQVIVEAKVEDSKGEKVEVADKTEESEQYGRSESEKKPKEERIEEESRGSEKRVSLVDELSNEEFQRRIESFIAKQVKFHLEEKSAIVTASC